MKVAIISIFFALIVINGTFAYSGGAPESVCNDMTPKHPALPKKSDIPYQVSVDKKEVKAGEKVQVTIEGGKEYKTFKGFLIQVRSGDKAVGSFVVPDTDKYAKAINCHGSKQSAATHKNSSDKEKLTLEWVAPEKFQGTVNVYATIAQDGGIFWVLQKFSDIKIN